MVWGKPMKSSKCHFTVSITIDGPTNSGRVENRAIFIGLHSDVVASINS